VPVTIAYSTTPSDHTCGNALRDRERQRQRESDGERERERESKGDKQRNEGEQQQRESSYVRLFATIADEVLSDEQFCERE
jgi:hypothetical protein